MDGPARFPTTRWSVVAQAGHDDGEALAALCRSYWYPVYAYIRRHGHAAEDARDLTQEFFAGMLASNGIAAATPDRGRFRSFLLASVRNFLANDYDKSHALKRGRGVAEVSLSLDGAEDRYRSDSAGGATPERLFERAWATELLSRAVDRLRDEYQRSGRSARFEALRPFLGPGARGELARLAQDLESSDAAARVAVHRFRARFGDILREEIATTLDDPREADSEVRYLLSVFGDGAAAPARAY